MHPGDHGVQNGDLQDLVPLHEQQVPDHQDPVRGLGRLDRPLCVCHRLGQWLLDEAVLARFENPDGELGVGRHRGRECDPVDPRISKQGIEVTPKLLAERLNVTEQDVVEMDQRLGNDEVSIDAPLNVDDDRETRGDRLLSANAVGADDTLANAELRAMFKEKLGDFSKNLNEKERFIFEKRLIADEPMTLQDIGTQYGVSRERARQIEAALIGRMRKYMQENIPDFNLLESED